MGGNNANWTSISVMPWFGEPSALKRGYKHVFPTILGCWLLSVVPGLGDTSLYVLRDVGRISLDILRQPARSRSCVPDTFLEFAIKTGRS